MSEEPQQTKKRRRIEYLSDDEDLGRGDDHSKTLLLTLKRGTPPPGVRVLYGLGLAGEGGLDYAALKAIEAIHDMDSRSVMPSEEDVIGSFS